MFLRKLFLPKSPALPKKNNNNIYVFFSLVKEPQCNEFARKILILLSGNDEVPHD